MRLLYDYYTTTIRLYYKLPWVLLLLLLVLLTRTTYLYYFCLLLFSNEVHSQ